MRLILALIVAASSAPVDDAEIDEIVTVPVTLDGVTLFRVRGLSALPAPLRARRIADRLEGAAKDPAVDPATVRIVDSPSVSEVHAGTHPVMLVSDADAELERTSRHVFAVAVRDTVAAAINRYRTD